MGQSEMARGASVTLMGLAIDPLTERETIARVLAAFQRGAGGWLVTANLDQLRQFRASQQIRDLLAGANIVVADGMPLVWAAGLQGTPLPERVAGSDLVWSLTAEAAAAGRTVYLLGDVPEARALAEASLTERYPRLQVAGSYSPPLGFNFEPAEVDRIRARLGDAQPDLVYVALGFPKQERLIAALRHELPQAWFVGVGISLSFAGGYVPRAPRWMRRFGLEWLHRLRQEPRRLARRYLVDGLPFGVLLLGHALRVRIRGRLASARDAAKVQLTRYPAAYNAARRPYAALRFFLRRPHDPDYAVFGLFKHREGVFLDVGANAGMSALSFRVFDRERPIVSIEANPFHRDDLDFVRRLARPMEFSILAADAERGTATLHVPVYRGVPLTTEASIHRQDVVGSPSLRARLGPRMGSEEFAISEVNVVSCPLDDLSIEPALIKIDVQGAETEVVHGLRETIGRCQPVILIEAPSREVHDLLGQIGYRPFVYDHRAHALRPQTAPEVNTVFLHKRDWP
ncbi:MAG: FkbM family methyltransferase [Actinobacteria bacterium]|nr:FkbM family methyltransferase [Actinomycetota bacterium]